MPSFSFVFCFITYQVQFPLSTHSRVWTIHWNIVGWLRTKPLKKVGFSFPRDYRLSTAPQLVVSLFHSVESWLDLSHALLHRQSWLAFTSSVVLSCPEDTSSHAFPDHHPLQSFHLLFHDGLRTLRGGVGSHTDSLFLMCLPLHLYFLTVDTALNDGTHPSWVMLDLTLVTHKHSPNGSCMFFYADFKIELLFWLLLASCSQSVCANGSYQSDIVAFASLPHHSPWSIVEPLFLWVS